VSTVPQILQQGWKLCKTAVKCIPHQLRGRTGCKTKHAVSICNYLTLKGKCPITWLQMMKFGQRSMNWTQQSY